MFNNKLGFFSRVTVALAFLLISVNSLPVLATAKRGRLEGNISDTTGAKINNARIILRDAAGVIAYQFSVNNEGQFTIEVNEGHYFLSVEATGFALPEKRSIDIRSGETQTINIQLAIAAISDQIVITATRTPTNVDAVAGSVDIITENDLQRKNQSQASEPLRLIPGVNVAQTGGRGGVTTLFVRGGESDYNKVLIDGVPVNAAGGLFDFSSLTPENLDRIEVVRGARSALFGSDAMTSVIQLFTRRGTTTTPELELSSEGGNFASHRETALISGLHRWLDYSASYAFQSTDGRFNNSDFINRSASANLGFALGTKASLRLTSRLNNNTLGVPGATARLFADPDQRQKHRDVAFASVFDFKGSPKWYQTARFIYSEFDTNSFDTAAEDLSKPDRPLLPPGAFGNDFAFKFIEHQKRAGFYYQTIAALNSANVLTGGMDYEHESAVFMDDFSRVSPSRDNLGFYIQDQMTWRDRLFITAGVRLERNSGDVPNDLQATLQSLGQTTPIGDVGFGVKANPKIAVSYLVHQHRDGMIGATRLSASFGTGIKEPSLTEAFSPNQFFLGNPGLKPERAISYDVGVRQEFFNRRASFESVYFDNRFRDQIIFVFDPNTFGPVKLTDGRFVNFINQDQATARGIELTTAFQPLLKLRTAIGYSWLRSRITRSNNSLNEIGLPLLRRPEHAGTFEISWVEYRFDLTVDGIITGERRDIDPVSGSRFTAANKPIFNDGYAKLNLAGTYRISNRVSAFARIENLLNQRYEEVLGYPAYKINIRGGLRLRIGGGN